MKTVLRNTVLCFVLIALLLAQCPVMAFAADTYPEIHYLQGGVPDESGAWTPEYWVDSHGNRVGQTTRRRALRAAENLPSSYDLRDYGLVTSVKHQAGAESCWAFSPIASLESNYIRQGFGTLEDTDFSEAHLVWFGQHQRTPDTTDPTYGDGREVEKPFLVGGNWQIASSTLMRGSGLQLEQNAPWIKSYDADQLMQMAQPESDRYASFARVWNVRRIMDNSPQTLKQMIMLNGAATLSYYDDYSRYQNGTITTTGYTSDKKSYYQTAQTQTTNHTVTVIGWDDNYSRTNFNADQQPTADGAWLIKGSWSTGWGDRGYYWISYEEPSLDEFVSYVSAPVETYDHIYQYDGTYARTKLSVSTSAKMANVFTSQRTELLTHAAFFSPNETAVKATVEIYVAPDGFTYGGTHPTSGMEKVNAATTIAYDVQYGYTTVELNTPVQLTAGRMFSVVVTLDCSGSSVSIPVEGYTVNNPGDGETTCAGNTGESFFGYGSSWYDTNAYNHTSGLLDLNSVPVKAMTRDIETTEPTLTLASAPNKTVYRVGETLDTTGLSLIYTDEYGAASEVDEGFACDPTTFTDAGTQSVTVTYEGLTVTFDVTVEAAGIFLVSDAAAKAGETVDVAVRISDNPGIVSAWLEVSYDTNVLELINLTNGSIFGDDAFTPGNDLTASPLRLLFIDALSRTNYTQNGDLAVLTFHVRTDAPAGDTTVSLSYREKSTYDTDLQAVFFRTQDGTVTVERLPGDVNADGVIDLKDVVLLRRFLAGWDVTVNLSNADVDLREGVDLRDVAYIVRFLVGGYDVTLH